MGPHCGSDSYLPLPLPCSSSPPIPEEYFVNASSQDVRDLVLEDYAAKVVIVVDGDTIEVVHNGKPERVRLNGIDCPEKDQEFGKGAKDFTADLVFEKQVAVNMLDFDNYGRTIAEVTLLNGRNLNRKLVKTGCVWWDRKYSKYFSLGDLEDEARRAKLGLWADQNSLPSWEWRKFARPGAVR